SRGCLQFCGTRTLRWAGRAWQPQNLPRDAFAAHEVDDLIVKANSLSYDDFKQHYPDPLKSVSMCMRGLVVPDIGKVLIMADYSQIEARLVAWYAGQWDALEVYETGGDIYKEMASAVFSRPAEDITKAQRHIGKCLVLGSGYGLGWRGLQRNLLQQGTVANDEDAQLYTKTFREKWSGIPQFWWAIKEALFTVFDNGGVLYHSRMGKNGKPERTGMKFGKAGKSIYIELATGLRCWFHGVKKTREPTPWDKTQKHTVLKARNYNFDGGYSEYTITHMIMAENICSMTARELMAAGMKRLNHEGYEIIMTVHDEIVMETDEFSREWDEEKHTLEEVEDLMCKRPDWGQDIPLAVEATVDYRYGK
ncbi:MAG: DNA polymerase, partial [Gammaproteobacteria bacterium]|nr:DNA polymerase [Gammaproteobacteria bacterium]